MPSVDEQARRETRKLAGACAELQADFDAFRNDVTTRLDELAHAVDAVAVAPSPPAPKPKRKSRSKTDG